MFTLFVCNIHSKITESTFEHFLQQGGLTYARLRMPDPMPGYDGNNRGFCFVNFATREEYDAAQRYLENRELSGKLLRTSRAHDRPPRPAPVRHDHYAANAVETRCPTVALQPDYRDYPPTGDDVREKGAR